MLPEAEWLLSASLNWTELDPSVPEASLDDVLAILDDQLWLVKLLDASVHLVDTVL